MKVSLPQGQPCTPTQLLKVPGRDESEGLVVVGSVPASAPSSAGEAGKSPLQALAGAAGRGWGCRQRLEDAGKGCGCRRGCGCRQGLEDAGRGCGYRRGLPSRCSPHMVHAARRGRREEKNPLNVSSR